MVEELIILYFSIFVISFSIETNECPKYKCPYYPLKPSNDGNPPCIQHKSGFNEIFLMPCQDSYKHCNIIMKMNNLQNSTCSSFFDTLVSEPKKIPGTSCFHNEECHSHYCKEGTCKGASIGESCLKNFECDIGLICQPDNYCGIVQEEGQICDESLICASYLICINKICTYYGTLSLNTIFYVENIFPDANLACASGNAIKLSKGKYQCKKGWRFIKKYGNLCEYENLDSGKTYTIEPKCGLSYSEEKFCKIGNANDKFIDSFNRLLDYLNKTKPKCSTAYNEMVKSQLLDYDSSILAEKFFCKNYKNLTNFYHIKWDFLENLFPKNYVQLKEIDICVKMIVMDRGYMEEESVDFSLNGISYSFILLFILLLIF